MIIVPRPNPLVFLLALCACGWSTGSLAQTAPAPVSPAPPAAPPADTIRLTDEERLAILDKNTPDSAAAARGELTAAQRLLRGIHGEVGAMIGSNGTRGIYGVAEIPLSDSATATVAVESSRFGGYRRR